MLIPGGSDSIIATIASLRIRGTAIGSTSSDDFFGITAESIRKAVIHGNPSPSRHSRKIFLLEPVNGDFRLVEF
jgi:hypothetical protein